MPPELAGYNEKERAAYETAVTEYDAFTRRNDEFYATGGTTVAAARPRIADSTAPSTSAGG